MTGELWKEEDDRSAAAQICQELVGALRLMGPIVVNECLEDVCNNLLEIYQKKSLCQQAFEEGDVDEEEEDLESEALLISSAGDLVAALCETVAYQGSNRKIHGCWLFR
ncbi:hypothetical protein G6F68_020236 [Rhizopus microsporus]|nr:hypothetical protein G6F68_020236 [Rhizopus microsporus]